MQPPAWMQAARKPWKPHEKLSNAATAHRAEVEAQLVIARAAPAADKEAHKGILGAPTKARKLKTARLSTDVKRLEDGFLPGEYPAIQPVAPGSLAASARSNAQHHAQPQPLPSGGAQSGRRTWPGDGDDDDDDDDSGASGVVGAGAALDDDDDDEDADFQQFYRVSPHQKAFNVQKARQYIKGQISRKVRRIEPPKLLPKNGCQPEHIGLGAFHMHAPHLEMGLPLPPCPRCGWKSVDQKRVSTNGICPARRVYASEIDEWVGGHHLQCGLYYDMRQERLERVESLAADDFSTPAEMVEALASVKAAKYCYRSYNPTSLKLYAARYEWWVRSLDYVILN